MLFFCTTVQQKGLLKEQVITLYFILNLASWSMSANQTTPYPVPHGPPGPCCQQHWDTANLQPLGNSHLTAHPTALPRCVPATCKSSQTPCSHFLQHCFTVCKWEAVCSSCNQALSPWLLGTGLLEYLAPALMQATVVWHPWGKREAGHRERELKCRSLPLDWDEGQEFLGQRH